MKGAALPRNMSSLGLKASQTLGGKGIGGGMQDLVRRSITGRRPVLSQSTTVQGTVNGDTGDISSGGVLEVTAQIPGAASVNYALWIYAAVTTVTYSGTMILSVASTRFPGTFSATGSSGVPANYIASGGDSITLQLVPTWSGGGTVSCSIQYAATRAA